MESQGFADLSNLVFQTIWKSRVEQAAEHAISIVLDLGGEAVEVHNVSCNMGRILHLEVLKLVLGIGNGVVGSCYNHVQLWVLSSYSSRIAAL